MIPVANGIPFRCKLLKLFLPKPPPAMTNTLAIPSGFSSSKSSPVSSKLPAVIPKSPETYWSVNTSSGVPYLSTYLPSIHKIWSDTRFAISSSWSDMITVRFFCLLSLWSIDKNSSLYFISRYEVGSSNTIISGCWHIARDSMTRCLCPSLIFVKSLSFICDTLTSSIASSTAFLSSSESTPNRPVYGYLPVATTS